MKPLRRCASVASVAPVVSVALLMVGQTARGQGVEEALDLATGGHAGGRLQQRPELVVTGLLRHRGNPSGGKRKPDDGQQLV